MPLEVFRFLGVSWGLLGPLNGLLGSPKASWDLLGGFLVSLGGSWCVLTSLWGLVASWGLLGLLGASWGRTPSCPGLMQELPTKSSQAGWVGSPERLVIFGDKILEQWLRDTSVG